MEGIIRAPLADIHLACTHTSEMVTQATLATEIKILDEKDRWYRIQIPLQQYYPGWVKKEMVYSGKPPPAYPGKIIVQKHLAELKSPPPENGITIMHAAINTRLWVTQKKQGWFAVWLPGEGEAWIREEDVIRERPVSGAHYPTRKQVIETAHRFSGAPYLWGGITPDGIDCSGLVYTVFALHGLNLHRDTDLQFKYDGSPAQVEEICPGDLIYFYEDNAAVTTHVGIYETGGYFINASSRQGVVSYSLAEDRWRLKIAGVKRILQE